MPTDDERREVARRLREYVDLPDDWWQETRAEFYVEKCVFGNVDRHSEAELFTRLADLIEPSEPKAKCVAEVKVDWERLEKLAHDAAVELTGVDRYALLALADEMDEVAQRRRSMGYEGFAIGDEDRARRIREALGVPDERTTNVTTC